MTASTTRVAISQHGAAAVPNHGGGYLKANAVVQRGWTVARDSTGYYVEVTSATGLFGAGIAEEDADATGESSGVVRVRVLEGVVDRENGTGADELDNGDIGIPVFGVDNQTVGKTSSTGTRSQVGVFYGLNPETGKARCFIGPLATAIAAANDPLVDLASTANGDGAALIGIEDAGGYYAATTVEAALAEVVTDLAATTATNGASRIGIQDAGTFTTATTVEAALAELYQHTLSVQAQINIPLASFVDADGDPIAKFSSASSPTYGFTLADSKAMAIRWNNDATPGTALCSIPMPQDLDDAAVIVFHFLASKSGATVGDATTLTLACYFQTVGALHDADADCGGATGALVGNATAKTVAELTRSVAAVDVPASPSTLTFTVTPTAGTLGTDDLILEGVWIEYKKKILTT